MANVTDDGVFNISRFFNTLTGTHFFTASDAERDNIINTLPHFNFEGNVFDSNAVVGGADVTSVFRFLNTETGVHFFTSNEAEKDNVIATLPQFSFEGIAYQAFNAPGAEREAVFRFFNTETGTHFYTSNEAEKDNIIATLQQFNFEGINYYVGGPAITSSPDPVDPPIDPVDPPVDPVDPPIDPTGTVINLTANADTTSATTPAANTLGTAGIDTYSGVFDPTGNATTISNADVLDGVGEIDVLNIRIGSTSPGGSTIAPVSSNVESFFLTNQATTDPFTLNFINIEDEAQVSDKDSVLGANTRAINVDSTATVGMVDTLGFYEVNFSGDGDRSRSSDAFTLALTGAGTATQLTNFSTVTAAGTIDNTFEIANISSTTTQSYISLGIDAMTLKAVNVSGDAALMLAGHDDFIGLSTVDASQMTAGGLNIDARDSAEANFNFTGSPADDRVVLKKDTIETASSLDGGAGKDTLATQNFLTLLATAVNSTNGFEVVEGVAGAESFIPGSATSINEFLFSGFTGSNNGFDITDIESNDRMAYSTDITSGGSYALRLVGKNAGNTATVELRAIDETNGETVFTTNTSNTNDTYGIELRSNISSFTLDSTGTSTNANLIETNLNNDFFGYAFENLTTAVFKITGSHDVTIMAKAGVDISDGTKLAGFSSAVNVDASTFTGVLRIAGSLLDDVIQGGSEADIIYSLGGADILTGNDGADQFRLAEFYKTTDAITDFVKGTDKVGLNEFDFGNTTATQAGATLSTTDYVENHSGITSIGNADAKKVIEMQASQDSGQIAANTGAAVEAYVLVHNTTSGKAELWYDDNWSDAGDRDHIVTYDNVVDLVGVQGFSNSDFVEYAY